MSKYEELKECIKLCVAQCGKCLHHDNQRAPRALIPTSNDVIYTSLIEPEYQNINIHRLVAHLISPIYNIVFSYNYCLPCNRNRFGAPQL